MKPAGQYGHPPFGSPLLLLLAVEAQLRQPVLELLPFPLPVGTFGTEHVGGGGGMHPPLIDFISSMLRCLATPTFPLRVERTEANTRSAAHICVTKQNVSTKFSVRIAFVVNSLLIFLPPRVISYGFGAYTFSIRPSHILENSAVLISIRPLSGLSINSTLSLLIRVITT